VDRAVWAGVVLILLTCAGKESGARPAASRSPSTEAVLTASRAWLKALGRGDTAKMQTLTSAHLAVFGFDLETGPDRRRCQAAFSSGRAGRLGGAASTEAARRALLECVAADDLIRAALHVANALDTLTPISAGVAANKLPLYRAELRKAEGVAVHLPRYEVHGVSLAAVLVLETTDVGATVRAAYFDSRFHE
jgi:hypothetical protein